MNCPSCNSSMDRGTVEFGNDTMDDFYLTGLEGPSVLVFRSADQPSQHVLSWKGRKPALRCSACQTLVVTTDEMTEESCLQCGEMLGPGIAVCPKCGWTYKNTSEP